MSRGMGRGRRKRKKKKRRKNRLRRWRKLKSRGTRRSLREKKRRRKSLKQKVECVISAELGDESGKSVNICRSLFLYDKRERMWTHTG